MARALFGVDRDVGQPAVRLTLPCARSALVGDRREKWMREPHSSAVELDDPGSDCLVDVLQSAFGGRAREELERRLGESGREEQRLASGLSESRDSRVWRSSRRPCGTGRGSPDSTSWSTARSARASSSARNDSPAGGLVHA